MNVRRQLSLVALVVMLLLTSCKNSMFRPASYGRAYEVVVVGDSDSLLYNVISAPIVGLPQAEPSFDVVEIASEKLQGDSKMVRNIVVLSINQRQKGVSISSRQNVYAQPQVIVTVAAPSLPKLKAFLEKQGQTLRNYLTKVELYRTQADIAKQPNAKAEAAIRKMFGIAMRVPADLTASRVGKDFLWLSNNAPSGMVNICLWQGRFPPTARQCDAKKHSRRAERNVHANCFHRFSNTRTGQLRYGTGALGNEERCYGRCFRSLLAA